LKKRSQAGAAGQEFPDRPELPPWVGGDRRCCIVAPPTADLVFYDSLKPKPAKGLTVSASGVSKTPKRAPETTC